MNGNNSTFNVVHGDQYNITILTQDDPAPRNTPPLVPHLVQTTTTLKTTNREAIAAYLGNPATENVTTCLIIRT
jgi:hypothetical protein